MVQGQPARPSVQRRGSGRPISLPRSPGWRGPWMSPPALRTARTCSTPKPARPSAAPGPRPPTTASCAPTSVSPRPAWGTPPKPRPPEVPPPEAPPPRGPALPHGCPAPRRRPGGGAAARGPGPRLHGPRHLHQPEPPGAAGGPRGCPPGRGAGLAQPGSPKSEACGPREAPGRFSRLLLQVLPLPSG